MSETGRPRNFAAALLFVLWSVSMVTAAQAESHSTIGRGTADESMLVTLSAACTLSSFRLPAFTPVASLDAGDCDARAVALVPGRRTMAVAGRTAARGTNLLLLSLPNFEKIATREIASGASTLLAPVTGPYLIAVDAGSNLLQVLDRDTLAPLREMPLRDRRGQALQFRQMAESAARRSVIIAFAESELWELFLATDAAPVFEGLVHDFRMGEGIPEPRRLPIRRIALDGPVDSFIVETDGPHLLLSRRLDGGTTRVQRLNLDVRRVVATSRLNMAPDELPEPILVPVPPGMMPSTSRDGMQAAGIPALQIPARLGMTGEQCRIAAAGEGKWVYLRACRGEDRARILVTDPASLSVMALLQPSAENAATLVIADKDLHHRWVVVPGTAGLVVAYRAGDWCRTGQLAIPGLKSAWIYP